MSTVQAEFTVVFDRAGIETLARMLRMCGEFPDRYLEPYGLDFDRLVKVYGASKKARAAVTGADF